MSITTILQSVCIMITMIVIGLVITRKIPLTAERKQLLVTIVINVSLPALILNGFFQIDIDQNFLNLILLTLLCSVGLNGIGILTSWSILHLFPGTKPQRNEMALLSTLGNTGFIGIPLCAVSFGPSGALLAAVFDAGLNFIIWSLGVFMLQKSKKFHIKTLKEIFNLPIISIIVGLILATFNFHPPILITKLTSSLAALASPIAMIYIGMLSSTLLTKVKWSISNISIPIISKLFLMPTLIGLFLAIATLPTVSAQVIAIQATMPCITIAPILFARYSRDEEYGGTITVISTFLSMLTIPFMVPFVMSFL